MSRALSVLLYRAISVVLLLFASLGQASGEIEPGCVDISTPDWSAKLQNEFGKEICLVGRLHSGPDGVDFVVDPPFGLPPYGNLVRTSLNEKQVYKAGAWPDALVALRGTLLGKEFCLANKRIRGCERPWATLNRYYFLIDDVASLRRLQN